MDIKNDFKAGVKICADAASDVAQALVEKSRLKAKANRIRQVIKSDTELRNQAYIELGRFFYENCRDNANEECESLCTVVDKTTARINKATHKYLELLGDSGSIKLSGENTEKIKKLLAQKTEKIKDTTQEKVSDIKDKAKEKASDLGSKAKSKAQDIKAQAKETVAELSDKAKDKVDDFKAFISPDEDIEEGIESDGILDDMPGEADEIEAQEPAVESAENETKSETSGSDAYDEESPEEFEF